MRWVIGAMLALAVACPPAWAEGPHFGFQSWFGGFDKAQLQVGFATYQANCASCHGLSLVSPQDLQTLGLTAPEVTALLAQGKPVKPASAAVAGDLSLYVAGQAAGAASVERLLNGYGPAPSDMTLLPGHYYNSAFPGDQIAMPPSLKAGSVKLAGGKTASAAAMAHDVAAFLAWTSDPTLDERKAVGLRAVLFLLVLGLVGWIAYRRRAS